MQEGTPKEFSGYQDGIEVGDRFSLNYFYKTGFTNDGTVSIKNLNQEILL